MSTQLLTIAILGLVALGASHVGAQQEHQDQSLGPGCAEDESNGSQGMALPAGMFEPLTRVRRQQPIAVQPPQLPQTNPFTPLLTNLNTNINTQLERLQSNAQTVQSMLTPYSNPNQAAAASQLQKAFQPQQQQQSGLFLPIMRVRRQQPAAQSEQQNPLGFLGDLGSQAERIQSSAKMFSSLFSSNPNTNQASQLQPQQQQQQSAASTAVSAAALMGQLSEMVRAAQDRSAKLAASSQQSIQNEAERSLQAGQQQVQQAQGGIQSALAEIGQGLQKIAVNNPGLLPDIKNLYSSVSNKLSSASSSAAAAAQPSSSSFPSSGPIVPAKSADQLVDNLGKVAMGQTQ